MNIYKHETSQTTVGGTISSTTLNIRGGLIRQVLVRANTNTTIFRVDITEVGGITILNYGYHNGEITDTGKDCALPLPVLGAYQINIVNASPEDTFNVRILIQE